MYNNYTILWIIVRVTITKVCDVSFEYSDPTLFSVKIWIPENYKFDFFFKYQWRDHYIYNYMPLKLMHVVENHSIIKFKCSQKYFLSTDFHGYIF